MALVLPSGFGASSGRGAGMPAAECLVSEGSDVEIKRCGSAGLFVRCVAGRRLRSASFGVGSVGETSARAALRRRSVADGCRNVSTKYYFQFLIFHFSSMISFTDYALAVYPFLELEWFHRTYYRVLEAFAEGRVRRLMISMPPQHGKSVGATTLLPAYLLGLDPDLRIAIASYSASLASKFNRRVQRILCSAEYGELFPDTTIKQRLETARTTSARPTKSRSSGARGQSAVGRPRRARSRATASTVSCSTTSIRMRMEANSPLVRENCWEWYTSVVRTRMHNDSRELLVFTRWHERGFDRDARDSASRWSNCVCGRSWNECPPTAGWRSISKRCKSDPALRRSILVRRARRCGPHGTTRRCSTPSGRSIRCVSSACTRGVPPSREGLLYGDQFAEYDALPREIVRRANYTDTADTGDDYLCSMSYAVDTDGTIYVTDLVYSREGMEVTERTGGRSVAAQRYAHGRCREQQRRPRIRPRRAGGWPLRCVSSGSTRAPTRRRASSPTRPRCSTRCGCRAAGTCAGRSSTPT